MGRGAPLRRVYDNGLCLVTHADGSKAYYYKIQYRGKVYNGSTRTDSLRLAEEHRDSLKTELRQQYRQGNRSPLSLPTLNEVHGEWLEIAKEQFGERHRKSVKSWWTLHLKPHLGHLPLDRITTKMVETTRAKYLASGGGPGGANSLLKVLKTLISFAIRRRYILVPPYTVDKLQVQRKPRPVLPAQAVQKFLAEIDRSRNSNVSGIIRLMLGLGLRENEALKARWEYLDLRRKTYQPGDTKSGKAPVLPVADWLAAFLKAAKGTKKANDEGWMFPSEDGEPHRTGFTRKPILRAGKKVGLANLTPHRLRATFATLHVEAGTALPKVQKMLGHSDITTTMRYVEDSTVGLREAQAKVAQVMGLGVSSRSARKPAAQAKGKRNSGTNSGTKRKPKTKIRKEVKSKQH